MTELYFVYDAVAGEYNLFPTVEEARRHFKFLVQNYEDEAEGEGEYNQEIDISCGRVYHRAELVSVEPDIDDPRVNPYDEYAAIHVLDLVGVEEYDLS